MAVEIFYKFAFARWMVEGYGRAEQIIKVTFNVRIEQFNTNRPSNEYFMIFCDELLRCVRYPW